MESFRNLPTLSGWGWNLEPEVCLVGSAPEQLVPAGEGGTRNTERLRPRSPEKPARSPPGHPRLGFSWLLTLPRGRLHPGLGLSSTTGLTCSSFPREPGPFTRVRPQVPAGPPVLESVIVHFSVPLQVIVQGVEETPNRP